MISKVHPARFPVMDGSANQSSANRESTRDATQDYPQSRGTQPVVCISGGNVCGGRGANGHRDPHRSPSQRPGDLLGLPSRGAGVRPTGAAAVRVRALVGHSGILCVCDAAGGLRRLRGDGGRSSLGRRQLHAHQQLSLVSGWLGQAAVVAGHGRGLWHELGEGVSSGKTRGFLGAGAARDQRAPGNWGR